MLLDWYCLLRFCQWRLVSLDSSKGESSFVCMWQRCLRLVILDFKDSMGRPCGVGNFSGRPYMLYYNLLKCAKAKVETTLECRTTKACVSKCPTESFSPAVELDETRQDRLDETDLKEKMRPFCDLMRFDLTLSVRYLVEVRNYNVTTINAGNRLCRVLRVVHLYFQ